jgi:putative PIN family toxin of toxin-antitoxin system
MRLVLDTNVAVAGLLWGGHSRRLLKLAMDEVVALYSSQVLINELLHTLQYPKFARRIESFNTTAQVLAAQYSALVTLVSPLHVPAVIAQDPDDDHVLACAVAARARMIVSGDKHLHSLGGTYNDVAILAPAQAVAIIEAV